MHVHSMCQPGRPPPHGLSHDGSPGFAAFQSAKSDGFFFFQDRDKDAAPSQEPGGEPAQPNPPAEPPAEVHEGELGADPQLDRAVELLKTWQVFKTFVAKREG